MRRKKKLVPPDTDIPCRVCEGRRIAAYGHKCGACFGTGLSTAPWDQRRTWTTVLVPVDDIVAMGEKAAIQKRLTRRDGTLLQDVKIESRSAVKEGIRLLISFRNSSYGSGQEVQHGA